MGHPADLKAMQGAGIQKFKTMPILILHGDIDDNNPVFLNHAAKISTDIGATDIFVGPSSIWQHEGEVTRGGSPSVFKTPPTSTSATSSISQSG